MIGNQAKCLTMVERLKDVGVNEIACLVDFGVNFSTVMASLKRLAALKDKFNETEEKVSEESSPDASFHWYFNR